MWVTVPEMPPEELSMKAAGKGGETKHARNTIAQARERQLKRFKKAKNVSTNADMRPKDIEKLANLSEEAEITLTKAARAHKLSARGYHRTIKLARTIADLSGNEKIETPHMLEALQYRQREI